MSALNVLGFIMLFLILLAIIGFSIVHLGWKEALTFWICFVASIVFLVFALVLVNYKG